MQLTLVETVFSLYFGGTRLNGLVCKKDAMHWLYFKFDQVLGVPKSRMKPPHISLRFE